MNRHLIGQPFEGELSPKPTQEEIDTLLEAAPRYGIEFIHDQTIGEKP